MDSHTQEFLLMVASIMLLIAVVLHIANDETVKVKVSIPNVTPMTDEEYALSVERCDAFVNEAVLKGTLKLGEINCG